MNTDLMFSSQSDNWATPQDFFEKINKEFDFNLDPCADEINHKCEKYYTREQNGLDFSWGGTEYTAIRRMEGISVCGLKRHMRKDTKTILLCAY